MGSHSEGWIGVDFDGTLAHYDHYRGPGHVGEPIIPMVHRVKRWLLDGHDVRIFTARVSHGPEFPERDVQPAIDAIEKWCRQHIGKVLPITNVKDYQMIELWDDRAIQVIANTGDHVGWSTRGLD
jgi:hypothetical protein